MKSLVIYIHGKGGNADEANHYKPLFPNCDVIGFDYKSETPWDAKKEFSSYFDSVSACYDEVSLIANSIGVPERGVRNKRKIPLAFAGARAYNPAPSLPLGVMVAQLTLDQFV